jgi:methionyl-tRNA formyltransferase
MRLVLLGTPPFAIPTFTAILDSPHTILAAFTQPDKPSGRGGHLHAPPVKQLALSRKIPVYQPDKLRRDDWEPFFRSVEADALVVVAYGKILPSWLLEIPDLGAINLHASLLPRYRGAAPINWAIVNGESVTGNTTMQIDAAMDTGDILLQDPVEIGPGLRAEELHDLLASRGADLMLRTLALAERGELQPVRQDPAKASYAPLLKKEDGLLCWEASARSLYNRVRGLNPWPGTCTSLKGELLRIWNAACKEAIPASLAPGTLVHDLQEGALVHCGEGCLQLLEVQWENRKRISGRDLLNGLHLKENDPLPLGK